LTSLPSLSAQEVLRMLARIGYEFDHQKGSHIVLRNTLPPHRRLTVPDHRDVAKGTLRAIVRQAGLTVEEFLKLR
jgi:predicted RNA binding protein YcfA (HicA-like mRNA interferase family)